MGSIEEANDYYRLYTYVCSVTIGLIVVVLCTYTEQIVGFYTEDEELKQAAYKLLFVLYFSTFFDTYKGML